MALPCPKAMTKRAPMDSADFLQTVHSHIAAMVVDGELGMAGYGWGLEIDDAGQDSVSIYALDLEPMEAWELALLKCIDPATAQFAFVLDRYGKPGQGTTLGDLVAGIYYERGSPQPIRPLIIEYTAKPSPRCLWFNWDNRYWNAALRGELEGAFEALRARRKKLKLQAENPNRV